MKVAGVTLILLLPLLGLIACGRTPTADSTTPLSSHAEALLDATASLSPADVEQRLGSSAFRSLQAHETRFGYTTARLWLHISPPLMGNPDSRPARYLVLEPSLLDEVTLYRFRSGQLLAERSQQPGTALRQREVPVRGFGFALHDYDPEREDLLLSVRTEGNLAVSGWLLDDRGLEIHRIRNAVRDTLILGAMLPLVLLNLLLFVVLRARSLLYLALFAAATVGHHFISHDIFAILLPEQAALPSHRLYLAGMLLSGLTAMAFTRHALILPRANPGLDRLIVGFIWLLAGIMLLLPFAPLPLLYVLTAGSSLLGTPMLLAAAAIRWRQGDPTARTLALTWGLLLVGIMLMTAYRVGWLPVPIITEANTYLLLVVAVLLLSFAIMQRLLTLGDPAATSAEGMQAAATAAVDGDRMIGELERRLHLHNRELREVNERLAALSEESERHAQTLSALFASSVAIHRSEDVDELLQTSLAQLGELFPDHGFGIIIHGERPGDVRNRAFLRIDTPLQALLTDHAQLLGSNASSTLKSLLLANSDPMPLTPAHTQHGGWQFLEIPERSRHAYGHLIIQGTDLPPRSVEVLSVFGSQITTAIENRRLSRELEELAHTDPLTGVGNRKVIEAALADAIRNATSLPQIPFCLLVVDVNSLKPINDHYGHEAGDAVIIHVARTLKDCVRREDTLARSGGDEFIILCPNTRTRGGEELAERIHRRLALHPVPMKPRQGEDEFQATVAIGIASSLDGEAEQTLALADARMYDAKERYYASRRRRELGPQPEH